ncbi:MAG: phosphoserine phosphatase SerB, partial [Stellaceae bacterium]
MRFVASLISAPSGRSVLRGVAAAIAAALPGCGAPLWLAEDEVCDLVFDSAAPEPAETAARRAIGHAA